VKNFPNERLCKLTLLLHIRQLGKILREDKKNFRPVAKLNFLIEADEKVTKLRGGGEIFGIDKRKPPKLFLTTFAYRSTFFIYSRVRSCAEEAGQRREQCTTVQHPLEC